MRRIGFVFLVVLVLQGTITHAAADTAPAPLAYRPPVDAVPLVDTFRPPSTPYGPGNRGVDYATAPGQPVHAAADGEVVFAGRIGVTEHHVVVLHADGLRTSYSFLAAAIVRRGERIAQGEPLGRAGDRKPLHFGVRAGEDYLDPLALLGQRPGAGTGDAARAHLVPDPDQRRPLSEAMERRRLLEAIRDATTSTARWVRDRATAAIERKVVLARVLAETAKDLGVPLPVDLALAALRWDDERQTCTPASAPTTPPPDGPRRIVVLVGGLGSATGHTAVLDVDTTTLGYDPADVHQFTYAADPTRSYTAADTLGDIGAAGGRLAALVAALQDANPGAAVDVVAHSQGGLVARSAVTTHHAEPATVVTLGTPHQGADLATAGAALDGTTSGHLLLEALGAASAEATGIDPTATSIRQMSEASDFLADLPEDGWPTTTHVVSIAARGDPIVPNHQSRLAGAHNAVVTPHGNATSADHARLPGSPEATAEIARALARQAPTCRSLVDTLLDEAIGRRHADAQDLTGTALAIAGLYVDARARAAALDAVRR